MTRLCVVVGLFSMLAGTASGQNEPLPGNGSEILRGLLHFHGIKPVTRNDVTPITRLPPGERNRVIVVVVGSLPQEGVLLDDYQALVRAVLRNEGGCLMLTDEPTDLRSWLGLPQLEDWRITGEMARHPDPTECFGGAGGPPYGLLAKTWFPAAGLQVVPKLATFSPSRIERSLQAKSSRPFPYFAETLASLPRGTMYHHPDFQRRDDISSPLMTGSDAKSSATVFVAADRGLFHNALMVSKDPAAANGNTANFLFACTITQALANTSRPGKPVRTRCLFLEDGVEVTTFDRVRFEAGPAELPPIPPIKPPIPPIPIEKLLNVAGEKMNEVTANLEAKNPFEKIYSNDPDGRRWRRLVYVLCVIGGVGLLGYMTYRGWGNRYQVPKTIRSTVIPATTTQRPQSLISARRWDMIDTGNTYEAIHGYTRAMFSAWGLPAVPPTALPELVFSGKHPPRTSIVRDLERLWQLAFGPPVVVPPNRLEDLDTLITGLDRAFKAGIWRFTMQGGAE